MPWTAQSSSWFRRCLIVLGVGVSAALSSQALLLAEDTAGQGRTSRSGAPRAGAIDEAKLDRKLNDILARQEQILQKLEEQHAAVMEELRIVKIRASMQ